jgi:hypothetical protein
VREEIAMADNTNRRGTQDRGRVADGQGYDVSYLARKHSISQEQAKGLIDQLANKLRLVQ